MILRTNRIFYTQFQSIQVLNIIRVIVKITWVILWTECLIQWTDDIHREYALSFLSSEYRDRVLYRFGMNLTLVFKSVNIVIVI